MISNILVVASIILVAIFVVAYKSKRQQTPVKCGCGKSETGLCDNSHASLDIIVSENAAAAPITGSFENIKETVTNDTGGYSPPTS
jgi:CDGSH-type Zn-finger protein